MNIIEAKATLHELANKMIERSEGVATMDLVAEFKNSYGGSIDDLSAGVFDDWLRRVCKDTVARTGRGKTEQLTLPGMGPVDAYVTVPDGEGGSRRKKLVYATEDDLNADEKIHRENVAGAVSALNEVQRRNSIIREAMQSEGFCTAGDAIVWLNTPSGG